MLIGADRIIGPADIIGAKLYAEGEDDLVRTVKKAQAYYDNNPYPDFMPEHWTEAPRVVAPIPRYIVDRSAGFLFSRPPYFSVPEDREASSFLLELLDRNRFISKLMSIARMGGIEGAVVLKFVYTPDEEPQFRFNMLSPCHVRFVHDPDDQDRLLLARIQYQRQMPTTGQWWWYREEWTESEVITYFDIPAEDLDPTGDNWKPSASWFSSSKADSPWVIRSISPNPFGEIPLSLIKNIDSPTTSYGVGDYWGMFDLFDRINLTLDRLDLQNQFATDPPVKFINTAEGIPGRLAPGAIYSIWGQGANAEMMEMRGDLRAEIQRFLAWLEGILYDSVGVVRLDMKGISGLGQMSAYALELLHRPLVELSSRKRNSYGEDGIAVFLSKVIRAASKLGIIEDFAPVECAWGSYFQYGPFDRQVELANIRLALESGIITGYDAAVRAAEVWDIPQERRQRFIDEVISRIEAANTGKTSMPSSEKEMPLQQLLGAAKAEMREELTE